MTEKLGERLSIQYPLDTWSYVAIGSSARVFQARSVNGRRNISMAIKIMRPDKLDYALPLFIEETRILQIMADVPGITRLLECGFLKLETGIEHIKEDFNSGSQIPLNVSTFQGEIDRFFMDESIEFLEAIETRTHAGWLPYLALQLRNFPSEHEQNLLSLFDNGFSQGKPASVKLALQIANQILDILEIAHQHNIWYRDHKICHYVWGNSVQHVYMIDWNISRLEPEPLTAEQRKADLIWFAGRVLFHMLTGDEHKDIATIFPRGPTHADIFENAPTQFKTKWTSDATERLRETNLQELLQETIAGISISEPNDLRKHLEKELTNLRDYR